MRPTQARSAERRPESVLLLRLGRCRATRAAARTVRVAAGMCARAAHGAPSPRRGRPAGPGLARPPTPRRARRPCGVTPACAVCVSGRGLVVSRVGLRLRVTVRSVIDIVFVSCSNRSGRGRVAARPRVGPGRGTSLVGCRGDMFYDSFRCARPRRDILSPRSPSWYIRTLIARTVT